MTKKTPKPKAPEKRNGKKAGAELSDAELGRVLGGARKSGEGQKDFG